MNDTEPVVTGGVSDKPRGYVSYTELQRHTSQSSLWVLINGMVYDVTALLFSHPGGTGPLLRHAGKDATWAHPVPARICERTDEDYGRIARHLCQYTHPTRLTRFRPRRASDPSTQLLFLERRVSRPPRKPALPRRGRHSRTHEPCSTC
ncbi:cytochrome b5-like heme/steroid binding domain-containing protein [Multifurca ochricompacta]|uniref:Cytochrome b5-like heme/steroid binding domain-containing protein n=1 Tax=Multifurca ochricompacta TaxID=376703 RepID=A0AAD4MDY3_9AGAM|nr:cytochrome b5-like heme/steroid binding domain-containing protein [Multifurca ochricompacta]